MMTQKVCRDRVLLPLNPISYYNFILMLRHGILVLSMFVVTTQIVMSRQDFYVFSLSLCCDPVCYVATGLFYIQLIILSRPSLLCRD